MLTRRAVRTIDDFGRLLLPIDLRGHLDWHPNDKLAIYIVSLDNKLILHKSSAANMEIDSHGRVNITPELRSELGWQLGDSVAITRCSKYERLILQQK